jgi:hypothetical protein
VQSSTRLSGERAYLQVRRRLLVQEAVCAALEARIAVDCQMTLACFANAPFKVPIELSRSLIRPGAFRPRRGSFLPIDMSLFPKTDTDNGLSSLVGGQRQGRCRRWWRRPSAGLWRNGCQRQGHLVLRTAQSWISCDCPACSKARSWAETTADLANVGLTARGSRVFL